MKNILILGMVLLLFSCKDSKQTNYMSINEEIQNKSILQTHPGKNLMKNQCNICHNPASSQQEMIAPPMVAIKAHYINHGTTKEDFIQDVMHFVDSPAIEKSKMRGAVRRFGLMPVQVFKKEEVKKIADYLFDYQIEEPAWFKEHWGKGHKNRTYINQGKKVKNESKEKANNKETGINYVLGTKAVLGKNLMAKIQQEGTVEALVFCNEKALTLTDSMSILYDAEIRRVSDKPRNPTNLANKEELEYIETFKKAINSGGEITPIVKEEDNKVHFYYPITTNSACLQCHGKPNRDIAPKTMNALRRLYPQDKAIGYGINELKGIWSIRFESTD